MSLKVTIADYGVGNLHSIRKALEKCGAETEVIDDMSLLADAKCIVFPGVGAFDKTMEYLIPYISDIRASIESGTPALGICIGAQIQFESSEEGSSPGLGTIKGRVIGLEAECVPHMGWNEVKSSDSIFDGIENKHFYFAHSFRGLPDNKENILGYTNYEDKTIPTLFRQNNMYGSQFHPEKSSESGLKFIKNFIQFAEESQ